ncbi:MAG: Gfo/Idh/MocA family oxidoreductase [Planctomycetes bacterium]|nr:Gfo/Idh/MocA family oxidoreductase [Planctomycetota bacterium]
MKLRVGVVGVGSGWDSRHRLALLSLSDRFEIRAVCCDVAQRAEQIAREFDAIVVDGYRSLSVREDIDAVLMLAPGWYGSLPILAACDAGKAIYCAAALDLDAERLQEVKNRIEESGVAFMAELPRRHAPATVRLKELIATQLGQPKMLFCHRRQPVIKQGRTDEQLKDGSRDFIELVDWCRYVVGRDPTSVFGVTHRDAESEESDYQMMSLDFSMPDSPGVGPLAHISCGEYMPATWQEAIGFRPPAALQVACQRGIAFIDLPATLIWFDEAGRHMESLESERPVGEQMLMRFHRATTSLVRKSSDLEDAYRAIQIVLSAHRSAESGVRVLIDD